MTLAPLSPAQRAACRSATYLVGTSRPFRLQAGQRSAELATLLRQSGSATGAMFIAANPFGRKPSAKELKALMAGMHTAVKALGLSTTPAQRDSGKSEVPGDAGLLVAGASCAQAEALMVQFGQPALLWCSATGTVELMLHPNTRLQGPL